MDKNRGHDEGFKIKTEKIYDISVQQGDDEEMGPVSDKLTSGRSDSQTKTGGKKDLAATTGSGFGLDENNQRPSLMRKVSQGLARGLSVRGMTPGFGRGGYRNNLEDEGWGQTNVGGRGSMSRRMSQALFHNTNNFENLQQASQMVFSEAIEFRPEVFVPMFLYHLLEPISLPFVLYAEGKLMTKNLGMLPTRTRWLSYLFSRLVLYGFVVLPIILYILWDMRSQVGYMSLCITVVLYMVHQATIATKYAYMTETQYNEICHKKMLTGEEAESFSLMGWLKQGADTVEREMIGSMKRLKLHSVGGLYFAFLPHQKFKVCKVCLIDDSDDKSDPALMSAFVIRSGAPEAARMERRKSRMFDPSYAQKLRRKSRQGFTPSLNMEEQRRKASTRVYQELKEEDQPLLLTNRTAKDDSFKPAPTIQEVDESLTPPKGNETSVQLKSPTVGPRPSSQNSRSGSSSSRKKELQRRNTPDIPGKVKNKSEELQEEISRPRTSSSRKTKPEKVHPTSNPIITKVSSNDDTNQSYNPHSQRSVSTDTEPDHDSTSRLVSGSETEKPRNSSVPPMKKNGTAPCPSSPKVQISPLPSPTNFSRPATASLAQTGSPDLGNSSRPNAFTARQPAEPVHVTVEDSRVAGASEPLLCLNLEQIIRTLMKRQEAKTPWKSLQSLALCLAWFQAMLIPAIRALVITDNMAYVPLLLLALGQVSLRYHLLMYMISSYYDLQRRDWILSHIGKIMDSGLLVDSPQPQAENTYMWLAMRRIVTEYGQPFQKRVTVFTSLLIVFAWVCLVWLFLLNLLILRDDGFFIGGLNIESLVVILMDSLVVYGGLFFIAMIGSKVNTKDVRHCAAINRQTTRVQLRILNWHPNMPRARSLLHKMQVLERVLKSVGGAVQAEGEYYKIKVLGMITSESIYLGILLLWGLTIAMAVAISV